MSYLYYFFTGVILFTLISLPGCSSSGRGGERISAAADTLTISLPIAQTDSITIIYTDNKTLTTCLSEGESRELDRLLRTVSYDPAWN
ncbi:MAG: hypothetical protein LUD15_06405 [Bacteroides sp.]|nr:hypothetical protein [Bacteroides sp.]